MSLPVRSPNTPRVTQPDDVWLLRVYAKEGGKDLGWACNLRGVLGFRTLAAAQQHQVGLVNGQPTREEIWSLKCARLHFPDVVVGEREGRG